MQNCLHQRSELSDADWFFLCGFARSCHADAAQYPMDKNQPKECEKYVGNENKVLLTLERIGEMTLSE